MNDYSLVRSIVLAGATDVGLVRSRNEDGMWLGDTFVRTGSVLRAFDEQDAEGGVFAAVADGVGGAAAGDVASRFVLEKMALLVRDAPSGEPFERMSRWFTDSAVAINQSLREHAEDTDGLRGMATTLTGLYLGTGCRCWVNAGDSRLYALSGGRLTQLTRDHTLREMSGNPNIPGNIIVNCFGTANRFYLDTGELPTEATLYLLCSDGLSDYADASAIRRILARVEDGAGPDALQAAARQLVEAALEGGGGDNITVVLVALEKR